MKMGKIILTVLAVACCYLTEGAWMEDEENTEYSRQRVDRSEMVSRMISALQKVQEEMHEQSPLDEAAMMNKRGSPSVFNRCYFSPLQCTYMRRLRQGQKNKKKAQ